MCSKTDIDDGETLRETPKFSPFTSAFQIEVKVLTFTLPPVRAELSPAKVHYIWVPAYFHPEGPGLWTSA